MGNDSTFYERLKEERARAGQPESTELETVVRETLACLSSSTTDARKPGMLLGKIQSGKTRAFLGIMAAAFDDGYDVAVVLTKGTRTLAQQTVSRIAREFKAFRESEELDVYDIMSVPSLNGYELEHQKLVIVAKKESNNMKRLLKLFAEDYPTLLEKRVLIVDDEADFASIRFTKVKDSEDIEPGRISDRIDELRRAIGRRGRASVLQVTATPYSLYLQPDEYEQVDGEFVYEPKRPAFTRLVPVHGAYVGGDHYFGEHDTSRPEYYLWHPVDEQELDRLRSEDRRRIKRDQALTSPNVAALRHAVISFVTGACIRRLQQSARKEPPKKYSMVLHVETSRKAHAWQNKVAREIVVAMRDAAVASEPVFDELVGRAIDDLRRSVEAEALSMPDPTALLSAVRDAFTKDAVVAESVNSDRDVEALLDENAELRLRPFCNIFIGGQILDRGITVPNLIGFYYGRSPRKMQQDTVLQHARMYGTRPRPDLAVTRFYTSPALFQALKRVHEFDSALRHAFETNAHDRGVAFVHKEPGGRVIPCAPSKVLASNIVALRPGRSHLPIGFQTKPKSSIRATILKIDRLVPELALGAPRVAVKISTSVAFEILGHVEETLEFETGYDFDWKACGAALEYFARTAAPPAERDACWLVADTGRRMSRVRADGERYSDAPDGPGDRKLVAEIDDGLPRLVLLRQDGLEEDGWRGHPFWWPVLYAPASAKPAIFASTVRPDDDHDVPDDDDD